MSSKITNLLLNFIGSLFILVYAMGAIAQDLPTIKVGILSYGTINWEIDTIKHHELDKQHGINVEAVKLTTKNAAAIALQSKAVDVILTDLFWVIKQGGKFKMQPTHKLSGGVYAKSADTQLAQINTLGVAGGANDKNLLVYLAYLKAQKKVLNAKLKYGAPPLLNEMMLGDKLDGIINFWHYNARLDAAGFHNILSTPAMLTALGIKSEVPLLGWVFHADFVTKSNALVRNFIAASNEAKAHLLNPGSDDWKRLKPQMKTKSSDEYDALIKHYAKTLLPDNEEQNKTSAMQLFDLIKNLDGQNLFKQNEVFPADIFIE